MHRERSNWHFGRPRRTEKKNETRAAVRLPETRHASGSGGDPPPRRAATARTPVRVVQDVDRTSRGLRVVVDVCT